MVSISSTKFLYDLLFAFSFQFPDLKCQTKNEIFINMFCDSKRLEAISGSFFDFNKFVHKEELSANKEVKLPFPWFLLK